MLRKTILPFLALTFIFWVAGCSENPIENGATDTPNLDDEFGGYTTATEAPAFGDTELLADDGDEVEYDDPMLSMSEVTQITEDPESGLFHFRAIWGQLCYDSTATDVIDWSGSLTISRGAEVIRRVIRFELGQDYILERYDRTLIEWHSKTTVHNDGIMVDLFVPPPRPVFDTTIIPVEDSLGVITDSIVVDTTWPELEPVTVTFETGPYTRVFTLGELAALDEVVYLEDSTAAIAFHAVQGFRYPCPGGFLAGHWGYDSTGAGVFRGRWMSRLGYVQGHLRGHFGTNDAGERVFYGKWVNRSGRFEGFLRGTWVPDPNETGSGNMYRHAGGWFEGRIFNANEAPIGVLRGKYKNAPYFRGGFFQGRWKLDCPLVPTAGSEEVLADGF